MSDTYYENRRGRSRSVHKSQYVVSAPRPITTEVVLKPTKVESFELDRSGRLRSRSRSALLREQTVTTYPEQRTDVVILDGGRTKERVGRSRSRGRATYSVVKQTNKYGETNMALRRSRSRPKDVVLVSSERPESEVRRSIEQGSYRNDNYIDREDDFIYESDRRRSRSPGVIDRRSRSRLRRPLRQLDAEDEKLVQEYRVEGIRRAPSRSRYVKQRARTIIRIAIDLVELSALQALSASAREVFDDEVVLTYNRQMSKADVVDIYSTIAYDGRELDDDEISCRNESSVDEYILRDRMIRDYSPSPERGGRTTSGRYLNGTTIRLLRDAYDDALIPISSDREIEERGRDRSRSRGGRSLSRRRRSIVRRVRPTPPPLDSYRFSEDVPRAEYLRPAVCTAREHTIRHLSCTCYDNNRSWDLLDRIRVLVEKASALLDIPEYERTREDYDDIFRYRAELDHRIQEALRIRRAIYERTRSDDRNLIRDPSGPRELSNTFGSIGSGGRAWTVNESFIDDDGYFPSRRITRRESTYFEESSDGTSRSRLGRAETTPIVIRGRNPRYDEDDSDF